MEGVFQAKRRSIKKALWLKWSLMHFRSWKAILAITQQEEKDGLWWTWRRRQGCSEAPEKEVIRFAFKWFCCCCLLLLFRCSVMSMSDSLQPHGFHHTRLPCPSLSPGVCSDFCLLSQWCHPTVSSSVTHLSCPQSFPASGSFPMSSPERAWILQFFSL